MWETWVQSLVWEDSLEKGTGNGYPFQYSGLENSMGCTIHGVAKSRTQLSNFHFLNTGVGRLSLLQGIFPTQGSDPGLPHGRRILYQLRHQGGLEELLNNEIFHSSLQIMSFLGLRVFKAVCTDILCVHI